MFRQHCALMVFFNGIKMELLIKVDLRMSDVFYDVVRPLRLVDL